MELIGFIKLSEVSCHHSRRLSGVVSSWGRLCPCLGAGVPVGYLWAVPPSQAGTSPGRGGRTVGGVDISILLWIGKELLKCVSFEVNLSGCPCACCTEQSG